MSLREGPSGAEADGLFARAKGGDQAAWDQLFRACYPMVIRVVRRKLNRPMRSLYDSSDFANDVMKNLAANVDRLDFPSIESLMAFLTQAAEKIVIDEYRRRHTQKRDMSRERAIFSGLQSDTGAIGIVSTDPTASQLAQAHEILELLLAREDEAERKVIELRRQGYSNAEIAHRTGWSVRKVQRFLKELRESLIGSADHR